ncbi:MAG: hypothetical protein ACTHOJ_00460 [Sphingomonas oligoaromativorans]
MKSATLICAMLGLAAFSVPASAADGELGFASSGTATVTVIIPPIQAGIAATEEGAVGLWTLQPGAAGLMVRLPDQVALGGQSSLDVFRANGNVFDVSLPASTGFHLQPALQSENKGLTRQNYTLSSDGVARHDPLQVMIRGI